MSAAQQCNAAGAPSRRSHDQGDQEARHGPEEEGVYVMCETSTDMSILTHCA